MAASNLNKEVMDDLARMQQTSKDRVRRDPGEQGPGVEDTGRDDEEIPPYTQWQALGPTGRAALNRCRPGAMTRTSEGDHVQLP